MDIGEFILAVKHFHPQSTRQICEALGRAVNCVDCPLREPCSLRGDLGCDEVMEQFLKFQ